MDSWAKIEADAFKPQGVWDCKGGTVCICGGGAAGVVSEQGPLGFLSAGSGRPPGGGDGSPPSILPGKCHG